MTDRSRESGIRAFLAVELGGSARRAAAELAGALRGGPGGDGVRWVRPEAFHVTLRFLGEIAPERVGELASCVAREVQGEEPFELRLGSLEALPSSGRARVVVLDLLPHGPLEALAAAVERAAVAAGFEAEKRAFRPHMTLGRVRRGGRAPLFHSQAPPDAAPFDVEEVVLFRSELAPTGARYTALERAPLGASLHPSNPSLED